VTVFLPLLAQLAPALHRASQVVFKGKWANYNKAAKTKKERKKAPAVMRLDTGKQQAPTIMTGATRNWKQQWYDVVFFA
jgi:hypothetical protein